MDEIEHVKLDELRTYPTNARVGNVNAIADSLEVNGQYRPIVVNRRTSEILAGNHTWQAARRLGWETIAVTYVDVDEDAARRIVLADNRTNDLASYDDAGLVDLLKQQLESDLELAGTGFDEDDLASLITAIAESTDSGELDEELERGKAASPVKRESHLDMILSINAGPAFSEAQMGYRFGWQAGVMTSYASSARSYFNRYPRAPRLAFMDNEWLSYDHEQHVAGVKEFRPKYATTRDLLTKQQAEEAGVEWLSVEQTLEQAAEISEYCDNVIVIPKYDVIDQIPEEYVLGYSVLSSYGRTALPIEAFRGRRVHLLGGSWQKQRAYLNVLGEDVVSFDNNNVMRVAGFGSVNMPDGSSRSIDEIMGYRVERQFYVAFTLSLANIATAIQHDFGVDLKPLSNSSDDEIDFDKLLPTLPDEQER